MADLGKLCFKSGGSALAFKSGGTALIFKALKKKPGACTIDVVWRPETWICQTYDIEHRISFDCTGVFTSGNGNAVRAVGASSVTFTLSGITGPAAFTLTFDMDNNCSTNEDPGVKVDFVAAQSGAAPCILTGVRCPSADAGSQSVVVSFDAAGWLTGVQ